MEIFLNLEFLQKKLFSIVENLVRIMMWQELIRENLPPKAELNTRNLIKRCRKASFGWVPGVQLHLLEKKWTA